MICAVCEKEFTSNRDGKVYCSKHCREKYYRIKKKVECNKFRYKLMQDKRLTYLFDLNKFYVTSLMNNERIERERKRKNELTN